MNRKVHIAEDEMFPELRRRINAVTIRIPTAFITDMHRLIQELRMQRSGPRTARQPSKSWAHNS